MERSHSIFCTNRHKIDITTVQSGGAKYIYTRKYDGIQLASQTTDIQLCLLVQQTGTIIADDMYVCMHRASIYDHHLLIAE